MLDGGHAEIGSANSGGMVCGLDIQGRNFDRRRSRQIRAHKIHAGVRGGGTKRQRAGVARVDADATYKGLFTNGFLQKHKPSLIYETRHCQKNLRSGLQHSS
jgi:hypothetical protein